MRVQVVLTASVLGLATVAAAQDLPAAVDVAPGFAATQPDVAVATDGKAVVVVFGGTRDGKTDVYVVRSTDGGATFGAPVLALDTGGRARFGCQRGPRVGLSATGNPVISACVQREAITPAPKYPQADLWCATSTDGGVTFGAPVKINDGPGKTATESLHALAVGADGTAHCAWLDTRGAKRGNQLWYAALPPRGAKPGRNVLAYASPEGSICACCAPAIALDPKGNPHLAFRNALDGARDAWLAVSRDKGRSFAAVKVGRGRWPSDG